MDETERKKDCGNNRQGELTKERGGTTAEAKDRKNGLKNEKEQQLKPKTELMDETERKKNCGNHRQGELTKERGATTAEAKDRNSGLMKEKEGHRKPKTSNLFFSFQYVTSQYSSLSDRWVVRNAKKMER